MLDVNKINMQHIKKIVGTIDPKKHYTTQEIADMKIILNSQMKPSNFTLYRLIHSNTLKAIKIGTGAKFPRYAVQGQELINYINKRY
jgi:excisionase family DNA binding protein